MDAVCDEEAWVELPEEFWQWERYAKLRRWLYGMRKAAAGWEEEYAKKFEKEGYKRGIGAPTVFHNKEAETRLVVHGDDFTFSGPRKELERIRRKMKEWYEIKDRGIMGSGDSVIEEVTILGRLLRWTEDGLEYEADPKHVRDLMEGSLPSTQRGRDRRWTRCAAR